MTRGPLAALGAVLMLGCGIKLRRDLSSVRPEEVVYDDACGLQDYFDAIEARQAEAPRVLHTREVEKVEGKRAVGGITTIAFETEFQLRHLRRLLAANWARLPEPLMKARRVEVEAQWAEKAAVRRVVTTKPVEISAGDDSWSLPYQVCLSDLLFGASLYKTRREMLGLPPPGPPLLYDAGATRDATPAADGLTPPR
jgi:hypothetical protein